jgi:dihydroorotase
LKGVYEKMLLLLKNGTVIDGLDQRERILDILIEGSCIRAIDRNILCRDAAVLDLSGKVVMPGLIDVHVHFREPGQEHKETIRTGSRAAAAGGFTAVVAEANTCPPIDTAARLERLLSSARQESIVAFFSKACITRRAEGRRLVDVRGLKASGAVALSDDGNPVPGTTLMRHALLQGKRHDIVINPHCEESRFYRERMLARYDRDAARRGRRRQSRDAVVFSPTLSYQAEAAFIKRDLELAERTGARIHISHVSMAASVEEIARAKKRGVAVTAEATPHHCVLTAHETERIGTNAKVNPPLRSRDDVEAVLQGLSDGTIDIIATDHAPHAPWEKELPWPEAPFGVIGLETAVGVALTYLVKRGVLTLPQLASKMSVLPARIFGLPPPAGMLATGLAADLTVLDTEALWRVDADRFYSKARNCPFNGWQLQGRPVLTIRGGRIIMRDGLVTENEP